MSAKDEFFPTPERIVRTLWNAMGARACVLEPSAGQGAIVDWMEAKRKEGWSNRWNDIPNRIDVIEADPARQMVLRGKAYNLVGEDFLRFVPTRRYAEEDSEFFSSYKTQMAREIQQEEEDLDV